MAKAKKAPVEREDGDEAPEGYSTVYANDDVAGFSYEGESYEIVDGMMYVPNEAVDVALSHGFSRKPPKD